ncbi:MAG: transglutaminase domain-containing protein, partial [Blautia wexlerae]
LLLSSVMALTPAMPAMAEQSTIVNYVDGTTDSTVETPDVTPTPLPEKKEGWETVDGVKYYYVNGEKITNKVKKIGKYTYCFDKTGKLVTNKPYYKVNSKTYYKIKKNGQATRLSTVETMAAVRLQKCKGNLKKAFNWSVSLQYAGNVKVSKKTPTEYGLYGFKTGSGDCYVMAATFYWMAKVAGYDAHYVKGYFQKSGGKKGAHAWVEIDQKVNGKKKTYVYDPNFQKEYKLNGYKLTYGAKRTLKYVNYKRVN